jgi:hypothetical protein
MEKGSQSLESRKNRETVPRVSRGGHRGALRGAGLIAGALGLLGGALAQAAPVKGNVILPAEGRTGRKHLGYWRVENGVVPIAPPAARGDTVVVLAGVKAQSPGAKTVTLELSGFQALQAGVPTNTVVVAEGSVIEFKNSDKVAHDLSIPDQPSMMPIERLTPGGVRRQKFLSEGGYVVRCAEYPHMTISVVVVATPYFAVAEDRGAFKLPDAPDGRATLKVWSGGRWVHQEEIDVGPKSADLQIKVKSTSAKTAAE